ncbi:MAG: CYTH domain-containing protein, partial [Nisaea sp.]
DRVLWISKGPTNDQCTAVDLADFDKALSMLRSLRLKETCQITKKRDIYFLDEFHITLDKLEGLGSFVELAVMTDNEGDLPALRGDLQRVAKELDLHRSAEIFQSYRQLLFG